ncbi:universal stress protein [Caballeronia sp. HLA56]
MYRKIMVALDGSDSQRVLDGAAHIAKCSNARVHIVSCRTRRRSRPNAFARCGQAMRDATAGNAKQRGSGCAMPSALRRETHGRAGFRRPVQDSVVQAFLRNSICPLLLIRSRPQA